MTPVDLIVLLLSCVDEFALGVMEANCPTGTEIDNDDQLGNLAYQLGHIVGETINAYGETH